MDNMGQRALILGCSGLTLTDDERAFFERCQPFGFILFARNCESPSQVRNLIASLKETVNHAYVPILIDQEGGRVARLKPPHWRDYPPAEIFGKIAQDDLETALWCAKTNAYLMGCELADLGINVNCAPVVDLFHTGTHPIIGDRAFGDDPMLVAQLASAAAHGLIEAGVTPVIKHLPGHGRALVDSHEDLPVVTTDLERLAESDFEAFRLLCQSDLAKKCWGMTAHIVYPEIDDKNPATQSNDVIFGIIRQHIGFEGFLLSDCVTMKALKGSYGERALKSLQAGCNAALHCSGVLDEMIDLLTDIPPLTQIAINRLAPSVPTVQVQYDIAELEAKLNQNLRPYMMFNDRTGTA